MNLRTSIKVPRPAVIIALAAFAGLTASTDRSLSSSQTLCAPSRSNSTRVGTLTRLLHTTVRVDGAYVGTAPCDLVAGDEIRTDGRGEAVFEVSRAGQKARGVVLPLARVSIAPAPDDSKTVVDLIDGRSWYSATATTTCSDKTKNKATCFSAGKTKIEATSGAVFGVDIRARAPDPNVLVKVYSGDVRVHPGSFDAKQTTTVKRLKALSASTRTGKIFGPPARARFDALDGVALAQLR
jgi:hypothetical protein